jgi:hypothetical protein
MKLWQNLVLVMEEIWIQKLVLNMHICGEIQSPIFSMEIFCKANYRQFQHHAMGACFEAFISPPQQHLTFHLSLNLKWILFIFTINILLGVILQQKLSNM